MDIKVELAKQWADNSYVPLPTMVVGSGSTALTHELVARRGNGMILDQECTPSDLIDVLNWLDQRRDCLSWVGLAVSLDRIGTMPGLRPALRSVAESAADSGVGMLLAWEGSEPLHSRWQLLTEHCVLSRLPATPVLPVRPSGGLSGELSTWESIARANVISALGSLRRRDHDTLEQVLQGWTSGERTLLMVWVREAMTGEWDIFSAADSYGFQKNKKFMVHVMTSVDQHADAKIQAKSLFLPMTLG